MEESRKHLVAKFQEYLGEQFAHWCEKNNAPKSDERLISFLIDQDLVPTAQILQYTVLQEFEKMTEGVFFQKSQSISSLAHKFQITERRVRNILKRAVYTERKHKHLLPALFFKKCVVASPGDLPIT